MAASKPKPADSSIEKPTEKTTEEQPQQGGSYIRNPDGTLQRNASQQPVKPKEDE